MQRFAMCVAILLTGCSSPPALKQPEPVHDATADAWYRNAEEELADVARKADESFRAGKADQASTLIAQGEPIAARLLAVPRPTLAATEAASDLDDLYGRMLLTNRHYGWARLQFQKNLARWKRWRPETESTARRLSIAKAAIAECDRRMEAGL